jgi:CBS domain-containing protein
VNTSTIKAEEIMTASLVTTTPQMHVLDAIERLLAHRVSGLPVVEPSGQLVGRFSERSAITAADLAPLESEANSDNALHRITASAIMNGGFVLQENEDVFNALGVLLKNRASGAPVIRSDGRFLGVFSEVSAMRVFIGLCWEQMPSAHVAAWLDDEPGRMVCEDTGLDQILDRFQETRFRRLMVVRDERLIGQVTRRDALQAALNAGLGPWMASRTNTSRHGNQGATTVQHWMLADVPTVAKGMDVLSVAQMFIESGMRQLPVMHDSQLIGQISRSDLLRAVQRHFPKPAVASQGVQVLYLSSVNRQDAETVVP